MKTLFSLLIINLCLYISLSKKPIVGILTHPIPDNPNSIEEGFISLNYAKWIEAAGGEIVPIHSWLNENELDEILNKVNGVLFQGGSASLDFNAPYYKISEKIFNKVIEMKNIYNKDLPLWATCLGFEALNIIVSKDQNILTIFDAEDIKSKLIIEDGINKSSKIFSYFSDEDIKNLREKDLTGQYHHFGVSPINFNNSKDLKNFFKISSYAEDRNKEIYITSIEAKNYAIFATQFHPEKTNFIKFKQEVPQGIEASIIADNFVNLFLNIARENENFMNKEDRKKYGLINSFEKGIDIIGKSPSYIYKKSAYEDFVPISVSESTKLYSNSSSDSSTDSFVNHYKNLKFLE
jgi:gamma-glutamyl hydrolase